MVAQKMQQTESPESFAPSAEAQPAHQQLASLAYPLWQQRGYPEGASEEDWLGAEQELLARSSVSTAL